MPMKIIFLDFDGVLDTAYYDLVLTSKGLQETDEYGPIFDPTCVTNLEAIINATKADIVVTSSWKYLMTYEELLRMWKTRGMPGRIIDATPNISRHRGDEIDVWLRECKAACEYAIIDDLDAHNFNEHQQPRLVTVNPYNGLDDIAARRVIGILGEAANLYEQKD